MLLAKPFPVVQYACWALFSCCCTTGLSGSFWACVKVKIISAFQLKVHSHTARHCHFWLKQPIKLSRRRAVILTTFFLLDIGEHGWEVNTDYIFIQMHLKAFSEWPHSARCFLVWSTLNWSCTSLNTLLYHWCSPLVLLSTLYLGLIYEKHIKSFSAISNWQVIINYFH